jgi:uncharacterized RDD family membrane protein YckC
MSEVVTGEAVVLELPVASFPGRLLARTIDLAVQLTLFLAGAVSISLLAGPVNDDYLAAVAIGGYLVVTVFYATLWETLTRGKTPGKMALGLRVVGDDGSPERFRQALVRSLVGLIEIYTFPPVALITSIVSAKGKRLGDVFAGTYVLQERMPARASMPHVFSMVPPPLTGWAQSLQLSALSDQTADAASSYLRRFAELSPRARESLGIQLANAVAAEVSPPPPAGTPPPAYLAAVLAVRRERDRARATANLAAPPPQVSLPPIPPPPVPPPPLVPPGLMPLSAPPPAPPPPLVPPGLMPPAAPPPAQPSGPARPFPPGQPPPDPGAPPTQPTTATAPGFAPPV